MQRLGLSGEKTESDSRLKALFWPDLSTLPGIGSAVDMGKIAAFLIAGVTTVAILFGFLEPAALIDAVLFLLIGFGIARKSRVAALMGLVLYVLTVLFNFLAGPGGNPVVPILIIFVFVNSVRACFAFHRKTKDSALGSAPDPGVQAPAQD